mgnify:CR=1 FL=1
MARAVGGGAAQAGLWEAAREVEAGHGGEDHIRLRLKGGAGMWWWLAGPVALKGQCR